MTTDRELVKNWEARVEFLANILLKARAEDLEASVKKLEELTRLLAEEVKFLNENLPTRRVKSTITRNQIETTIRLLKEKVSVE